ncbi:PREDICTED: uncharacterized protein KIAA1109-like [Propithecus coquereli]|uniref:uncharacterized protein KIAA1109-like n=1 Tax=Propithecus coquereli TaxID=379532 RepID=UPI00063FD15F|nr:PREDICTED: uncharacterized protein KIAA1109-like [Propithecus coquereli]
MQERSLRVVVRRVGGAPLAGVWTPRQEGLCTRQAWASALLAAVCDIPMLLNIGPPRLMGEGFVVMQSNDVDIYYYMDEPGLVPEETEENIEGEISSEDCKLQDLPPCWGLDIVCGKGTDFNYGPWADRQRDCLWKFFFPPDYQVLKVSEIAQPGRPRQILAFELRMNIIADATIDLLFTKNRVIIVII